MLPQASPIGRRNAMHFVENDVTYTLSPGCVLRGEEKRFQAVRNSDEDTTRQRPVPISIRVNSKVRMIGACTMLLVSW